VLQAALEAAPFEEGEVAPGPGGPIGHAAVQLANPTPLALLEAHFGPAHRGPSRPAIGAARVVQFNDTLPPEGSIGGTVLAELDDRGQVVRVMIRRDAF
jgi:hypothetical protein